MVIFISADKPSNPSQAIAAANALKEEREVTIVAISISGASDGQADLEQVGYYARQWHMKTMLEYEDLH